MKKGDVVMIKDSSYSKVVTGHGLEDGYDGDGPHDVRYKQGVIIELGCKFPNPHRYQTDRSTFNNTIVRLDSGKVVFIEECFLRPVLPTHKVMIDVRQDGGWMYGEIVEISDKLYKEIKQS